jgi:Flp pilus assembly protein CpaB
MTIGVPSAALNGVYLEPADRVDVLPADLNAARVTQNVLVVAVKRDRQDGTRVSIVLQVTPKQAEQLFHAQQAGQLSLVLLPSKPEAASEPATEPMLPGPNGRE